jgi:hypothetical protein
MRNHTESPYNHLISTETEYAITFRLQIFPRFLDIFACTWLEDWKICVPSVVRSRKDVEYCNLVTEIAKIATSEVHSFTPQGAKKVKSVVMVIFCIRKELLFESRPNHQLL